MRKKKSKSKSKPKPINLVVMTAIAQKTNRLVKIVGAADDVMEFCDCTLEWSPRVCEPLENARMPVGISQLTLEGKSYALDRLKGAGELAGS